MIEESGVGRARQPSLWVVSAPSNLGLRPPESSATPGTAKAPEAFREAGLITRLAALGAVDNGVVLPQRYVDDPSPQTQRLRNHDRIIEHSKRLADRLSQTPQGAQTLVLGGDCSILMAAGIALRRRGRFGLVHIDGHTDYRHPGNSDACGSLAGEDLAAVTGKHWPGVADIEGLGPYFRPEDSVHIGCREDDLGLAEVRRDLASAVTAREWLASPDEKTAEVLEVVRRPELDGYWLHLDVDVLDPALMPAVDSPSPGGWDLDDLQTLLLKLWPDAVGLQICVFDPDLDPDGRLARDLAELLTGVVARGSHHTASPPPPAR